MLKANKYYLILLYDKLIKYMLNFFALSVKIFK